MINDRKREVNVHSIQLRGRDRTLANMYTCILGLFPPLVLACIIIRYDLTSVIFFIILSILFLIPIIGYLINVAKKNKEEMHRLEFCVKPEGLYYLNHFNGKSIFLNWSEIRMINPVFFYNYERRLDIIPMKGKRITINLEDYTFRLNPYTLRRTIIHFSGRDDIWNSKGPLFLW